jgi:glutaredoxin
MTVETMPPRPRAALLLVLAASLAAGPLACRNGAARKDQGTPSASASVPTPAPIVVRDDSAGLTFSWITLDGGFQLAKTVAEVPYEARDAVRVWSETSGDGVSGPWIFVADLRTRAPDGTYKVEVLPRAYFEDLAAARRAKNKAAKAPTPKADGPEPSGAAEPKKGAPKVIIYGADWCKPCHLAEAWLKSRGIPYEHKDVDDPNVNEEMREKLMSAGIQSHSIPVLDVGGKILVGFSEITLEKALKDAGG